MPYVEPNVFDVDSSDDFQGTLAFLQSQWIVLVVLYLITYENIFDITRAAVSSVKTVMDTHLYVFYFFW